MFFKKSIRTQNKIDTLIGAETRINGDIHFKGGLRVDGSIIGNVIEVGEAHATLVLSEHGRVEGEINVSQVMLNGSVVGSVRANHLVELQSKAVITGDVYYKTLEMHTGAVIEGKLIYLGDQQLLITDQSQKP